MNKREDYISWDEYFMGVAMLSAMRSKDHNTQLGAFIVREDTTVFRSAVRTMSSRGTGKASPTTINIFIRHTAN